MRRAVAALKSQRPVHGFVRRTLLRNPTPLCPAGRATRPRRSPDEKFISNHTVIDLDLVQWPAMVVTVGASWLVASKRDGRRSAGFWVFLLSNAIWIAWGLHSGAHALVVLQVCLAAMNIRGAMQNDG